MIAWNFQRIVGTCQFRVPWFGYPCGYSSLTFDRDLTAHTSKDDYVLAMQKMIEYCYARSQGDAVIIPLIGAGLSKTKYGERAILEYLVKSLKLNKDLIVSDIYIVVRNSGKETIPITEL